MRNQLSNLTSMPQSEPRHITSARALVNAITAFNARALSRSVIADADRAAIGDVRRAIALFLDSRTASTAGLHEQEWQDARQIANDVTRYLALTEGSQTIVVVDEEISTPAIESPSVRAHIARFGEQLISRMNGCIAELTAAGVREEERRKNEDATLALARQLPMIGPTIQTLEELMDRTDSEPDVTAWAHAGNALVPAIAELLVIPPVEAKLGRSMAAQDLIEIIRRQRRERLERDAA